MDYSEFRPHLRPFKCADAVVRDVYKSHAQLILPLVRDASALNHSALGSYGLNIEEVALAVEYADKIDRALTCDVFENQKALLD